MSAEHETKKAEFDKRLTHVFGERDPRWTRARINNVISLIEENKRTPSMNLTRDSKYYYYSKNYEVAVISGEKCLIQKKKSDKDPVLKIVPSEEYFDIIYKIHHKTNHGGRDRLIKTTRNHGMWIPTSVIITFLVGCKECVKKRRNKAITFAEQVGDKIGRVAETADIAQNSAKFSSSTMLLNDVGHLDLIDLQFNSDGRFKWILHYQDLGTKFSFLRPMTSIQVDEIATELLKIFLEIGCPKVIKTKESEFTDAILCELINKWPVCVTKNGGILNEKETSSDVENMVRDWMQQNNSTNWAIGVYHVQFKKNCTFDLTICATPYKALFGVHCSAPIIEGSRID